jgi:hypothetical protein
MNDDDDELLKASTKAIARIIARQPPVDQIILVDQLLTELAKKGIEIVPMGRIVVRARA